MVRYLGEGGDFFSLKLKAGTKIFDNTLSYSEEKKKRRERTKKGKEETGGESRGRGRKGEGRGAT